jgi:hypothetical protein
MWNMHKGRGTHPVALGVDVVEVAECESLRVVVVVVVVAWQLELAFVGLGGIEYETTWRR